MKNSHASVSFLMLLLLFTSISYGNVFANDIDEDVEKIKEKITDLKEDLNDADPNVIEKILEPEPTEQEIVTKQLENIMTQGTKDDDDDDDSDECPCPPPGGNGTIPPPPPPPPEPPVAKIKPENPTGQPSETIVLTAAESQNAVSYKWEVGGNLTLVGSDSSAMVTIKLPDFLAETAEQEVTLTVTNKEGASDSETVNVQITGLPPQPPVCTPDSYWNGTHCVPAPLPPPIEPSNSSQILIGDNILNWTDFGEIEENNYTKFWTVPKMFDNETYYESAWSQFGTAGWTVLLKQPIEQICSIEIIPYQPQGQNYKLVSNGFTASGILDAASKSVDMPNCITNVSSISMEFNNPGKFNSINEVKFFKDSDGGPGPVIPPIEPGTGNYTLNIQDSNIKAFVSNSTIKFFFDEGVVVSPPVPTNGSSISIGGKN